MPFSPLSQFSRHLRHLVLGRAGLQAHEGVAEVVIDVVVLRREVVALGLAFLADELGVGRALVHVVRDRPHVVEEFGIDGPAVVFLVHRFADQARAGFGDGVAEQEVLAFEGAEGEPFVPDAAFVGGFGRAGEPALVDAAAVGPVGIEVAREELDAAAGMQEGARHPGGREAQEAAAFVEGAVEDFGDAIGLHDVRLNHGGTQTPALRRRSMPRLLMKE